MNKLFFIVCLVSIFPLLSLLTPGLPVTHDGQDHVARIANFYQSLLEGNIVPRWANNLNWGFGHPVLMFLYPLPSYVASFFHFFGFSLIDSVKIVFALAYVVSIIAMYMFVKSEFGEESGVLAAILYGFVPYRFINLYVRGAIGEHMAFIFLPFILWGMFGLARKKRIISWGLM
ncbi:MAG: glycosyltransferase family 39 protein, partial [Patescibacteria group bacterium]|nr:glycosyltransferase family 39 protein [Patescibacteria group bacterium]